MVREVVMKGNGVIEGIIKGKKRIGGEDIIRELNDYYSELEELDGVIELNNK